MSDKKNAKAKTVKTENDTSVKTPHEVKDAELDAVTGGAPFSSQPMPRVTSDNQFKPTVAK